MIEVGRQWSGCMQAAVSADGSDPREVKQWRQQQAAESELAAAEEAMEAGHKVRFLMFGFLKSTMMSTSPIMCRWVFYSG